MSEKSLGKDLIESEEAKRMTMKTNISISNEMNNPAVNNLLHTISLEFTEPVERNSIDDKIKVYRLDFRGNLIEEPCTAELAQDNKTINLKKNDYKNFAEGQAYKLEISSDLKSSEGSVFENGFEGYFATNSNFKFSAMDELEGRSQIVVISDLHLGVDDAFAECRKNKQALAEFLNQLGKSPNVKELVIAGDLLDGWFLPMDYELPESQAAFFDLVASNNQDIIDEFNAIITAGKIEVIYVPGNHDILLTKDDINRIFPGIKQARDEVQGLGRHVTGADGEIVIEHGHRYNVFCAPDQLSNRSITNNDSSVLPPGYFFTRIATSSVVEGRPSSGNVWPDISVDPKNEREYQKYVYYRVWRGMMEYLPVNEKFSERVIKTNIDGYTSEYAINDLIPYQNQDGILEMNLYSGIHDTWKERQQLNGVNVQLPTAEAIAKASDADYMDQQSKTQFFEYDDSKKIVVFGHSHVARILPFVNKNDEKTIYANSGTWIDDAKEYDNMTFVVITPPQSGSAIQLVNLYKYSPDKTVTQCAEAQAIVK